MGTREKQKNQREISESIEDFSKNRVNKKSGISKQEWEQVKNVISLTPKQQEYRNKKQYFNYMSRSCWNSKDLCGLLFSNWIVSR
jgi:hypothetical protein